MGCFSTCFNTCKPSRLRHRSRSLKAHPSLLDHLKNYQSTDDFKVPLQLIQEEEEDKDEIEEKEEEENGDSIIEASPDTKGDEKGEKANLSGRKKVTFDLNVKFYENSAKEEETEEINEEEEGLDGDGDGDGDDETEQTEEKSKSDSECQCGSDSTSSSLFSYPINHRYHNIRDSDDEFDDMLSDDESDYYTDDEDINDVDGDDNDDDGDEVKPEMGEEQSSESLFSLSVDSRKKLGALECHKEVNSPLPLKNGDPTDSNSRYDRRNVVLNPVENLTQWKDIKSRLRTVSENPPKENLNVVQDFSFPVKNEAVEREERMAVDTSLSTWLGGSGKGTMKRSDSRTSSGSVGNLQSEGRKVSPNKFEDRPILGALTVEEIRQISAGSTGRKSPRKSPDDMPIIGSVGSYWSHTGQGTDSGGSSRKSTKSRYRESAEIIWDATPFETRLEKALEKEAYAEPTN